MGHNLPLFATRDDYLLLLAFLHSKQFILVPLLACEVPSFDPVDPADGPFCYLSFRPLEALTPHANGTFMDVLDPIIEFTRPYEQPPYLVAGRVYWNDDSEALGAITQPFFRKIQRWVRKNWRRREEDDFYVGPGADALLASGAAQVAYLPPGITIRQVTV